MMIKVLTLKIGSCSDCEYSRSNGIRWECDHPNSTLKPSEKSFSGLSEIRKECPLDDYQEEAHPPKLETILIPKFLYNSMNDDLKKYKELYGPLTHWYKTNDYDKI